MLNNNSNDFQELFQTEIQRMYDMENELVDGLQKMADNAQNPQLKQAFMDHRSQTVEHAQRLQQIAQMGGFDVDGEKDKVTRALVKEAGGVMDDLDFGAVRDAALIGCAQKVEHVEMAAYGTARTLCQMMGMQQAVPLLEQTLQEEKQADQLLTRIAESGINQAAVQNQGGAYAG